MNVKLTGCGVILRQQSKAEVEKIGYAGLLAASTNTPEVADVGKTNRYYPMNWDELLPYWAGAGEMQ